MNLNDFCAQFLSGSLDLYLQYIKMYTAINPKIDKEYVPYNAHKNQKKERGSKKKASKWNLEENIKYVLVLQSIQAEFDSEFVRRSERVFKKLSKKLKHRTAEQCRSHHQKMIKKHYTVENIIQHFKDLASALICDTFLNKKDIPEKMVKQVKQTEENLQLQDTFSQNQNEFLKTPIDEGAGQEWNWMSVFNF